MATATATTTETAKVTAGDVGGGGGNTAIAATATAMTDDCRFFYALNLIKVRKENRQIKNVFHCTCT